ncbi:MAG: hypothetical protein JEZ08_04340 [Clostridiales bacterium]|nr:hypothetical protein [Clostridiales bacterium]
MFGGENNKRLFIIIVVGIILWLAIHFFNLFRVNTFNKELVATHSAIEATLLMGDLKIVVDEEELTTYKLSSYDVVILERKEVRGGLTPYGRLLFATEQKDIEIELFELSDTEVSVRTQFQSKNVVGKLKGVFFLVEDELLRLIYKR